MSCVEAGRSIASLRQAPPPAAQSAGSKSSSSLRLVAPLLFVELRELLARFRELPLPSAERRARLLAALAGVVERLRERGALSARGVSSHHQRSPARCAWCEAARHRRRAPTAASRLRRWARTSRRGWSGGRAQTGCRRSRSSR